jgi:hypothetical protein
VRIPTPAPECPLNPLTPQNQSLTVCTPATPLIGTSAYPIRATLLNISYGKRVLNIQEVGTIPDISELCMKLGFGPKDAHRRVLKLAILAKCLSVLLHPMKQLSISGTRLTDPDGIVRHVFPRLFSYVAGRSLLGRSWVEAG